MFDAKEIVNSSDSESEQMPRVEELPLPSTFTWGCATSAYQIEGGYDEDGKGQSVWDRITHMDPSPSQGEHGDIACDHYHRMPEDVDLMASYEVEEYRFSIAWSRIIPLGSRNSAINEAGVAFYSGLIDRLLCQKIKPVVSLYHWDMPQALHDEYGGLLNPTEFKLDFAHYVRVCFERFGGRVRSWITFNEPYVMAVYGSQMQPGADVWHVGHAIILAHAAAVQIYSSCFQSDQQGKISIALNSNFFEPYDPNNDADCAAAERRLVYYLGWFADPIFKGSDYPAIMRDQLGDRLPKFTSEEYQTLREAASTCSAAFFGLNHYTSNFARDCRDKTPGDGIEHTGQVEELDKDCYGQHLGPVTGISWLRVAPNQFRKLLIWIWERYHIPILITENGCPVPGESLMGKEEAINDEFRIQYFGCYLDAISRSINEDGVQMIGYYAWSLMDNFEWTAGYGPRFGITHIDYQTLERTPKRSAKYLSETFRRRRVPLAIG